jgi:hypothetical protein
MYRNISGRLIQAKNTIYNANNELLEESSVSQTCTLSKTKQSYIFLGRRFSMALLLLGDPSSFPVQGSRWKGAVDGWTATPDSDIIL